MKQLIKMTIPLAAIFLLAACGNNESKEENHEGPDHAAMEQKAPVQATANVLLKDDNVHAVYQHYIHLSTALANSDVAGAKIASNAIEAGAKEVNGAAKIASSAVKITEAADIETMRSDYSTLSNDMLTLLKKKGLAEGELYIAFCPMAFNGNGASWISSSKEIRNPYFGEKMPGCGEVKEIIN